MTKTKIIEFEGSELVVQTKDGEINMIMINSNGVFIPVGNIMHPDHIKKVKDKFNKE